MRACGRLKRNRRQAGDFGQIFFKIMHQLEHALAQLGRQKRVRTGKTGQRRHFFIDFRVVFHGAGSKRVHAGVNTEIPG